MSELHSRIDTPLGPLLAVGDGHTLTRLHFADPAQPPAGTDAFAALREQLEEYFAGARTRFDVALSPAGRPFERRVWAALAEIPYGRTITYGELARRVGARGGARAVGAANGRNPIAVIVPCHRVIGADGTLTGYAGGLGRKQALLDLESGALPLFAG